MPRPKPPIVNTTMRVTWNTVVLEVTQSRIFDARLNRTQEVVLVAVRRHGTPWLSWVCDREQTVEEVRGMLTTITEDARARQRAAERAVRRTR